MIFTILAFAAIFLAAAGFIMQKNGELAGLGRERTSRLRAPHGPLVRTKRLDKNEEIPPTRMIPRVLIPALIVTAIALALCLLDVLKPATSTPVALQGIIVVVLAAGIAHAQGGVWRAFGWSIVGYLVVGGVVSFATFAFAGTIPFVDTAFVNMTTMVCGAIGASLAVSFVSARRSYAREFEDGYVNVIEVAGRSVAARAFDQLADPSWRPSKDVIEKARAGEDVRNAMNRRAGGR